MRAVRFFVALILLIAASPTVARADARAPLGYLLLCVERPDECQAGGASSIVVTDESEITLEQINSRVNQSITPRREEGADEWTVDASAGDCADYVLATRHRLIALGLPPSALRI